MSKTWEKSSLKFITDPGSSVKPCQSLWGGIILSWICGFSVHVQDKYSWMGFLQFTKEFKFPVRHSAVRARGGSRGLPHKQDPADRRRDAFTETDRLILTIQTRPAPATWSFLFAESLSRLTLDLYTSSAGSPSSSPEGVRTQGICVTLCRGVCVCVCAGDTKDGDLIWHERRLKKSCLNWSQLLGPQCRRSCSRLLTVTWVRSIC